jgi:hypothetical protein
MQLLFEVATQRIDVQGSRTKLCTIVDCTLELGELTRGAG